jgi:predicted RNA-binding Zn-ribbon protein involved in translation (DUF1610 family)
MGLLDGEIEPGHEALKCCPSCGEDEIGRRGTMFDSETEYYCDYCGYKPNRSEAHKSFVETFKSSLESIESEKSDEPEIADPQLRQQVEDKKTEGWEIEEITDSGNQVVMSTTEGGSIGGHALTGALTGLWTFGLGNVAYKGLSEKKNKERIVLRAGDETDGPTEGDEDTDPIVRIRELKQLNEDGLITDDQFEEKKEEILDDM